MLPARASFAAVLACFLLLAGSASAARTQPVSYETDPPTTAHRSATARPAALASKRTARRPIAPLAAAQPAATLAPPVAPIAALPQLVSLTGLVFDASGRLRPGVCVFPTTDTHHIAVTDAKGRFQLQVPAQTAVTLQAEYVGVGSNRITVTTTTVQPVHIVLGR